MGRARDRADGDFAGKELIFDADGDTSITADTDDQIDIRVAGSDQIKIATSEVAFNEASGDIDFRVEGNGDANALFVEGESDNVGIGNNDPLVKLDVTGSNAVPASSGTSQTGALRLGQGAGNGVMDMGFDTSNSQGWIQATNKANLATNYTLNLNPNSGDVKIGNGNLVIGTSGKGIDFSATANSSVTGTGNQAELLADYEKGTWTPNDASGANITYAQKQGSYVKIGDQVTAWGYINTPSSVTHTGAIQINGLPFTTAGAGDAQSGTSARGGGMISFQNTGEDFITVITIRDSQQIEFFNESGNNLANNILNGSKTIMFAVTYHTGIA